MVWDGIVSPANTLLIMEFRRIQKQRMVVAALSITKRLCSTVIDSGSARPYVSPTVSLTVLGLHTG